MSALITLSDVSKRHGAETLFSGISLTVSEGERLGVIGPNGAGKSTILRIIAAETAQDSGTVTRRRDLRTAYCGQSDFLPPGSSALELARQTAAAATAFEVEREQLARGALSAFDIDYFDTPIEALSGGQRKRLQLALGLCQAPDLLLLDEPTNHLDIDSILTLEEILSRASFAWIVISHDRWFLESSVVRIMEINPMYPAGALISDGSYADYLEYRQAVLAALAKQRDSLENIVRNEIAWLRQGAKARSTKAKHRIDKAFDLMSSLALVRARDPKSKVAISFEASGRKTKRLLELHGVSKSYGERTLFKNLTMSIVGGQALGLLGRNGSGKTSFARLLAGTLLPESGTIKRAPGLSVAHFNQTDDITSPELPLKRVLAEEGDSVVYRGNSLHVASWAKRFRFAFEQLNQPYGTLSGGEKARARIARLMLATPDLLILDEPTNDLDIETLEMLEQSLLEFSGAVVLVTHDRFMINRVCNSFLGLDGAGGAKVYADYEQWEREVLRAPKARSEPAGQSELRSGKEKASRKRLGYLEQRELDSMEERIQEAEQRAARLQAELGNPSLQSDPAKLQALCESLDTAHKEIETLYQRWAILEKKQTEE